MTPRLKSCGAAVWTSATCDRSCSAVSTKTIPHSESIRFESTGLLHRRVGQIPRRRSDRARRGRLRLDLEPPDAQFNAGDGEERANYMNSQLIKMEALLNGFAEGIALDDRGYVSEGSGENIFLVTGDVVLTPPLSSSILPGITRDSVIQICQERALLLRSARFNAASTLLMSFSSPAQRRKSRRFVPLIGLRSARADVAQSRRRCRNSSSK